VQPTYPGDPNGQNDPDPRAHEAGELTPVADRRTTRSARLLTGVAVDQSEQADLAGRDAMSREQARDHAGHPDSERGAVRRPGRLHRQSGPAQRRRRHDRGLVQGQPAGDTGGFVTTEPVATEDWMPLNNHPSAKPTYDFYDTVPLGKTAVATGELVSQLANLPDTNFPGGSTTWHWHSPEGVASYLVENSIGSYDLKRAARGERDPVLRSAGQRDSKIRAAANKAIMDMQEDITSFQTVFNGPFPFTTDGVVIGVPSASFEEEMQSKITFAGGAIDLDTFHHENSTSGGGTTSPKRTTTSPSSRRDSRRSGVLLRLRATHRPQRVGRARRP